MAGMRWPGHLSITPPLVSLLAGLAMNVEFNPVRATEVALPAGAVFVIANSLTVSNKAETAPKR